MNKTKWNPVRLLLNFALIIIASLLITSANVQIGNPSDRMRGLVRMYEFDFSEWTVDALFKKAVIASLKLERFLSNGQNATIIESFIDQVQQVQDLENELEFLSGNPEGNGTPLVIKQTQRMFEIEKSYLSNISLLAEAVVQSATEKSLQRLGFGLGGQVLPPVLYHISDLPKNLIVSPRSEITTILEISLKDDLDIRSIEEIEDNFVTVYNNSALVESIGGISAYPTMVMQTSDLNWLTETVSHEWIHNYLFFSPLGIRYDASREMRTINETVANLAGKEVGLDIIKESFPQFMPGMPSPKMRSKLQNNETAEKAGFNFRSEMRETRLKVDDLLSHGKIVEAEEFMELRRQVFWNNGYYIRKLNQAYFAFHGAYNDLPGGGASGSDPVGPTVRTLRSESDNLYQFIHTIRKVRSFEELRDFLEKMYDF